MKHLIAPSILSCDFAYLGDAVKMINNSQADWIHVDVMDGVFVPNISIGVPVLQAIKKHTAKPLDVHLMISDPTRYIEVFQRAGASIISIHLEACPHLHCAIRLIKQLGCKAGVALNPHTPVSALEDIVDEIDLVCVMSVNPGFGGQQFIEHTYEKIKTLKGLIARKNANVHIEVDGGISQDNAGHLIDTGANVLVAGHHVFSSKNPNKTIEALKVIR